MLALSSTWVSEYPNGAGPLCVDAPRRPQLAHLMYNERTPFTKDSTPMCVFLMPATHFSSCSWETPNPVCQVSPTWSFAHPDFFCRLFPPAQTSYPLPKTGVATVPPSKNWTLWELNPRPFISSIYLECETKIIPLDQAPGFVKQFDQNLKYAT